MKKIIKENERGFLFKNGKFIKMLSPGKVNIKTYFGEDLKIMEARDKFDADSSEIASYMRDEMFNRDTIGFEVPDGMIGMWFIDGRLVESLKTGSYRFWNVFEKNTLELIDISKTETDGVPREYFDKIPNALFYKSVISQGEMGILIIDGVVQKSLTSGTYFFWNSQKNIVVEIYDLRVTQIEVSGQEILTMDKVALRLNFVFSFRITDAVAMSENLKDEDSLIYSTVQLVLRQYVGRFTLDELLDQKNDIASYVLKKLQEVQDRLYVEFIDAGLKDVIFPGEIRDIMNSVLVAEKKAQANVISRREEVASTRSLLNTAKLLDENATLARLKEMESLERIFDKVGNISVSGGDGLLSQLKEIVGFKK